MIPLASTQQQLLGLKTGGREAEMVLKHCGQVQWSMGSYWWSSWRLYSGLPMLNSLLACTAGQKKWLSWGRMIREMSNDDRLAVRRAEWEKD
jgi:hypothetical protein